MLQFLNSTPLLPSAYPGRLASGNSTDLLPFLLNHLRVPPQETPSILFQLPEIFSIINNEEHFQTNAYVHSVNTRHNHYLHKPTAILSETFQKSEYYAGMKIFNYLPSLTHSLTTHSFMELRSRLSATTYSIYSQLPSKTGGRLLHPRPEDAPCCGDKGPT
jgi:hypothetical protein